MPFASVIHIAVCQAQRSAYICPLIRNAAVLTLVASVVVWCAETHPRQLDIFLPFERLLRLAVLGLCATDEDPIMAFDKSCVLMVGFVIEITIGVERSESG
jgi:hypothetical protein